VGLVVELWNWQPESRPAIQRALLFDRDAAFSAMLEMTNIDFVLPIKEQRIEVLISVIDRRRDFLIEALAL
jgi:hypothetical protein